MQKSIKHTIKTDRAYFLTLTVVNWVDVFSRKNHRDAFIDSLRYCQEHKGLVIFAYVIMTNHVHLIANANEPFLLKDVVRDLKKFTSKKIVEQIQQEPESRRDWMSALFMMNAANSQKHKEYKFWQEGNHAIELFSENFVWVKINYIHNNPVKAGFVSEPQHWIYSSASNYYGLDGILSVDCLPQRLITV
jgi:putative transposase